MKGLNGARLGKDYRAKDKAVKYSSREERAAESGREREPYNILTKTIKDNGRRKKV